MECIFLCRSFLVMLVGTLYMLPVYFGRFFGLFQYILSSLFIKKEGKKTLPELYCQHKFSGFIFTRRIRIPRRP